MYSIPKSRNGYQACKKGYQTINVKRWWTRLQILAIALPKQYSILFYFLPFFILSGYQSEVYSIVTIMTIAQKYQNRCKNPDFSYPDCMLVGIQDFQSTSGYSRRNRVGWTVCHCSSPSSSLSALVFISIQHVSVKFFS